MKVYRVTRRVRRPHYGHWKEGGTTTRMASAKSLLALLKTNPSPSLEIIKIEEADVSPFVDVTERYL